MLTANKTHPSCPTLCDPIDGNPLGSRPWDSPGKNTGVGCHVLLQCMEVKGESEVSQACLTLHHPGTGSSNSILPACINPPTLSWSFQFAHECAAICLLSGDKKIPNSSWPRFPAFPVSRPPNGLSPSEVRSPQVVLQTRTTPLLWRCLLPAAWPQVWSPSSWPWTLWASGQRSSPRSGAPGLLPPVRLLPPALPAVPPLCLGRWRGVSSPWDEHRLCAGESHPELQDSPSPELQTHLGSWWGPGSLLRCSVGVSGHTSPPTQACTPHLPSRLGWTRGSIIHAPPGGASFPPSQPLIPHTHPSASVFPPTSEDARNESLAGCPHEPLYWSPRNPLGLSLVFQMRRENRRRGGSHPWGCVAC